MTTEIARPLNQILETLELQKPDQATETQPALSLKDRQWCKKWLHLVTTGNSSLVNLETAAFHFCCGYSKTPASGRMLVLYGNNGVGKTHTAKAVHKWANAIKTRLEPIVVTKTHLKKPDAEYVHWPTFLDEIKGGDWDLVSDAEQATLLILDEVGGGHDPSKMGLDKLCRILSRRENKWTLVTTNFVPDAWEEVFDRRVVSRLFRSADHVDLSTVEDYSTKQLGSLPT